MQTTDIMSNDSSIFLPCDDTRGTIVIETINFRLTRMSEGEKAIMKKSVRHDRKTDDTLRASLRKEYEVGCILPYRRQG
ncbi:MAG: hypothetical protein ACI4B3_00875 [Prevotella sp.]